MGQRAVTHTVTHRTSGAAAASGAPRKRVVAPWRRHWTVFQVPRPTIDARGIAELYGIAVNSVYRLHLRCAGFPSPCRLGRRCIWDREAVMAHFVTCMGWVTPGALAPDAAPMSPTVGGVAATRSGHPTTVRARRRRATPAPHGPRGPRL